MANGRYLLPVELAVAQIADSLTDIDFDSDDNTPHVFDPDDSFSTKSEKLGWVLGIGVERQFTKSWPARLESSYFEANFAKDPNLAAGYALAFAPATQTRTTLPGVSSPHSMSTPMQVFP